MKEVEYKEPNGEWYKGHLVAWSCDLHMGLVMSPNGFVQPYPYNKIRYTKKVRPVRDEK